MSEDLLEEGMVTHLQYSSWTEEPGGLQSIGSQRVRHNWRDWACTMASDADIFSMFICQLNTPFSEISMFSAHFLIGFLGLFSNWKVLRVLQCILDPSPCQICGLQIFSFSRLFSHRFNRAFLRVKVLILMKSSWSFLVFQGFCFLVSSLRTLPNPGSWSWSSMFSSKFTLLHFTWRSMTCVCFFNEMSFNFFKFYLFLAVLSLCCGPGFSLVVVHRLLIAVVSLFPEHRL